MRAVLRYWYIPCIKNIFSPLLFCKNKLSPLLVSAVFIAVAFVPGAKLIICGGG